MTTPNRWTSWLWKIPVCGAAYALGVMAGWAVVGAVGLELPRSIAEMDPAVQSLLLLAGGMVMALGLAAMAIGLAGRWWERWLALGAFLFLVDGIGNTLEGQIFTTLGGSAATLVGNLPGALLCALAVSRLFPGPDATPWPRLVVGYLSRWRAGALAGRLVLAILAFPFCYFLFGMMVAPIVVPHYQELDFLAIPPMATMLKVLFTRSVLLLVASLLILAAWRGSRRGLIVGLGAAHSAAVGVAGLIQATFFPAVLRTVHSVEIIADSFVYAWLLALLLLPRAEPQPAGEASPPESPATSE